MPLTTFKLLFEIATAIKKKKKGETFAIYMFQDSYPKLIKTFKSVIKQMPD